MTEGRYEFLDIASKREFPCICYGNLNPFREMLLFAT